MLIKMRILFMFKKTGFTLAEILISLAILGVVAAVTLPSINANVNNQAMEKQTLKFYTQFKKAIDLYKAEEGVDSITGNDFKPDTFASKYFNLAQKCNADDKCYPDKYTSWNGKDTSMDNVNNFFNNDGIYVLADGTVFSIDYDSDESVPLGVYFDVNGKKGPNKVGYDFWHFNVYYDGSIDESSITPEVREYGYNVLEGIDNRFSYCKEGGYGGCFGHFMRNNFKFDY